jgi:hypothetical protein
MENETILEGFLREMFLSAVIEDGVVFTEHKKLSPKLLEILTEIEFWEAGSVEIKEEEKEVWVSADNGLREITEEVKSFFTF